MSLISLLLLLLFANRWRSTLSSLSFLSLLFFCRCRSRCLLLLLVFFFFFFLLLVLLVLLLLLVRWWRCWLSLDVSLVSSFAQSRRRKSNRKKKKKKSQEKSHRRTRPTSRRAPNHKKKKKKSTGRLRGLLMRFVWIDSYVLVVVLLPLSLPLFCCLFYLSISPVWIFSYWWICVGARLKGYEEGKENCFRRICEASEQLSE